MKHSTLLLALILLMPLGGLFAAEKSRPNILHIHADDHHADGLHALGTPALVYLMDLFPTFAEFAGAKLPEGVEGKSLCPILEGKEAKIRDVLYTGYRNCMRAIRDDRWKLIRYPLVDRTQVFDLSTDPLELNNLADKPEQSSKVAELTALLQKEMTAHADTTPLTVSDPRPAEWDPATAK